MHIRRVIETGLALTLLAACRREDPLEQLLAQQQQQQPDVDAVMQQLAQQPAAPAMDLPRPPPLDEAAAQATMVSGTVVETMDASNYTYLKLRTHGGGEEWAAVPKTPVTVGQSVRIQQSMVMTDFHSPSLNRTFASIIFGNLAGSAEPEGLPPGHPPTTGNAAPPAPATTQETPPNGWKGAIPSDQVHGADAQEEKEDGTIVEGLVEETMDASSYTYLRVKGADGVEEWAAVNKAPVKRGDRVKLRTSVVMHDFHSPSMNRTFPRIVFASLMQ